jgi:hypothetical protein
MTIFPSKYDEFFMDTLTDMRSGIDFIKLRRFGSIGFHRMTQFLEMSRGAFGTD